MKLIDILVRELPKLGGWPIGADGLYQNAKGHLVGVQGCIVSPVDIELGVVAEDVHRSVTREQYEAALTASKTEWDGEGLPPVGCECEALYDSGRNEWFLAKIIGHDNGAVIGRWLEGSGVYSLFDYSLPYGSFRPIRSEADKKRDEVGLALYHAINWNAEGELVSSSRMEDYKKAYDAIAAGKIPHIRID